MAAAGLFFIVSALAVKRAFGKRGAAFGFLFAYPFWIELAVFRHKITSKKVFAEGGGLFKARNRETSGNERPVGSSAERRFCKGRHASRVTLPTFHTAQSAST
jgi:hypothetical protein